MKGTFMLAAVLAATPALAATPTAAVRLGWAYGLGAEYEYRPGNWGVGLSGGYVAGFGPGGYAGAQWGQRPLGQSGWVAEGGLFYGQHNPLRASPSGLGAYAMGGYAFAVSDAVGVRVVAGEGVPFATAPRFPTFEFIAKLTAGVAF